MKRSRLDAVADIKDWLRAEVKRLKKNLSTAGT